MAADRWNEKDVSIFYIFGQLENLDKLDKQTMFLVCLSLACRFTQFCPFISHDNFSQNEFVSNRPITGLVRVAADI